MLDCPCQAPMISTAFSCHDAISCRIRIKDHFCKMKVYLRDLSAKIATPTIGSVDKNLYYTIFWQVPTGGYLQDTILLHGFVIACFQTEICIGVLELYINFVRKLARRNDIKITVVSLLYWPQNHSIYYIYENCIDFFHHLSYSQTWMRSIIATSINVIIWYSQLPWSMVKRWSDIYIMYTWGEIRKRREKYWKIWQDHHSALGDIGPRRCIRINDIYCNIKVTNGGMFMFYM